jgi:WD40 repeat protein
VTRAWDAESDPPPPPARRGKRLKLLGGSFLVLALVALVGATLWMSGRPIVLEGHSKDVVSLAFSPAGDLLASASWDKSVRVWSIGERRSVLTLPHPESMGAVAFSPDGSWLATGGDDGRVRLFSVPGGKRVRQLYGKTDPVTSVAFSPDGKLVAAGGTDKKLHVWSLADGSLVRVFEKTGWAGKVAFSSRGDLIACGGWDGAGGVFSLAQGSIVRRIFSGFDVAFSPSGEHLACGSTGGDVWIEIPTEVNPIRTLAQERDDGQVGGVAWSPSGDLILAGATNGGRGELRLWSARDGSRARTFRLGETIVHCVAYSPDGERVAGAGSNGRVYVWRASALIPIPASAR